MLKWGLVNYQRRDNKETRVVSIEEDWLAGKSDDQ
jgi:hypothetical protein